MYDILKDGFGISNDVLDLTSNAESKLKEKFSLLEEKRQINQLKVIKAMQDNCVNEGCFAGTNGYGYDDKGREVLDIVFAQVFGAEDALVRHNFVSGTHALAVALEGNLREGDKLLSVTGRPYDTLSSVLGLEGDTPNSFNKRGIEYGQVDFLDDGNVDFEGIKHGISKSTKMVLIQRSRGYSLRPSLSVKTIGEIVQFVKSKNKDVIVMVDNCYGEFVEEKEPSQVGADLVVGSLIKNPGGGIAPTGGYIVGSKKFVDNSADRLICAGLGRKIGATLGMSRQLFQGLFFAPHVVGESLKGAFFCGEVMTNIGFEVFPKRDEERTDIVCAIKFGKREPLIAFCQGIQSGSVVDSFVVPEPWDMPGYECPVIMASGGFVQGSSIEISADAPIREPFVAYMQGGVVYENVKLAVMKATQRILMSLQK